MIKQLLIKIRKSEQFPLMLTLAIVFVLMSLLNGQKFFSFRNVSAMMYQMPMIGLLAIGMLISELSGGINLSLVANANFNGVVIYVMLSAFTGSDMASANTGQLLLAILIALLASSLLGAINGLMIAKLQVPALLATLGTMTLLQGLSLIITKGYTVSGFPSKLTFLGNGAVFGIPMSIILFGIVIIGAHFVLNRTVFGKQLYMTGANPIAAKYSNVNTTKVLIVEYIFSAWFAFFASILMIGQMNSVKANYYESYLLIAVLASFLGGVNPNGGFGKLLGTVLAAIILQLISTGLNLMRLDPFMVTAMWGAIIIFVLFGREFLTKGKAFLGARRSSHRRAKGETL